MSENEVTETESPFAKHIAIVVQRHLEEFEERLVKRLEAQNEAALARVLEAFLEKIGPRLHHIESDLHQLRREVDLLKLKVFGGIS